MTTTSFYTAVLRRSLRQFPAILTCRTLPFALIDHSRALSSSVAPQNERIGFPLDVEEELRSSPSAAPDDLRSRIFRLRFPKRSATAAIEKWIAEGEKATAPELRQIARDLRRSQRYKHALEISEWMKSHQEAELSDSDYAMRIDLITKVFGVSSAEDFFEGLPSMAKSCEAYTALLHSYAGVKLIEKAERLFERILDSNFSVSILTFNEMMTLYASIGQLDKIHAVIEEVKRRKISLDLFTYNLWISATAAALDIEGAQRILKEMASDSSSDSCWATYMRLADIYITAGHFISSDSSLVDAENKIFLWLDSQSTYQASAADEAARLDLILKVEGIPNAELHFEKISNRTSKKAACLPLLHSYVKQKELKKAEALFAKLHDMGFIVNPHPYNEIMKLYAAEGQFKKIIYVIRHMKLNMVPLNVLSYNLWLNACGEVSDIPSLEMVYKEMMGDKNVEVGWSTYCTLANVYTRSGLVDNAVTALRAAEYKLSVRKRLGYSFVMTNYAALGDKDGVLRLWESSKRVPGKIPCANYMCVISCLVKLDDISGAERIFRTWESQCCKYDVRIPNIILGAYMRNECMDKAELLFLHALKKGGAPNYKTWEILMEGWVKCKQMDKAVKAMKMSFSMLKNCIWRPQSEFVLAIAKHYEQQLNVDDFKKYVEVLRPLRLMNLHLYKSLIRVHIKAQRVTPNILEMMARDGIEPDDEIRLLVQCTCHASSGYICDV